MRRTARRMRGSRTITRATPLAALVSALLASALVACSLLTSLDDLSGGAPDDAGRAESANVPEGGGEATTSDDATSTADAPDDAATRSEIYASAVRSDAPRGYWRLEESAGALAKEETGRYGGTYLASPALGQPGVAGSLAIKLLKGSQARMSAPGADFRFPGNVPYSVELWVKPGVIRDYALIGGDEISPNANGRAGWSLVADGQGIVHFEVWIPTPEGGLLQARGIPISSVSITMGAFHHVVAVYTGKDMLGYIDGVLGNVATMNGAAPEMGASLLWGCRADISFCLDDWSIDEIAVYDHVLDASRVTAHYDLGK
jgi:hypothetical protein